MVSWSSDARFVLAGTPSKVFRVWDARQRWSHERWNVLQGEKTNIPQCKCSVYQLFEHQMSFPNVVSTSVLYIGRPGADCVLVSLLVSAAVHHDGGSLPLRPQLSHRRKRLGRGRQRRPRRGPLPRHRRRGRGNVSTTLIWTDSVPSFVSYPVIHFRRGDIF